MRSGVGGRPDDVRENVEMDVCMGVRKRHLTDDWSVDIEDVLSCSCVISGEKAGMDSGYAVTTYWS